MNWLVLELWPKWYRGQGIEPWLNLNAASQVRGHIIQDLYCLWDIIGEEKEYTALKDARSPKGAKMRAEAKISRNAGSVEKTEHQSLQAD